MKDIALRRFYKNFLAQLYCTPQQNRVEFKPEVPLRYTSGYKYATPTALNTFHHRILTHFWYPLPQLLQKVAVISNAKGRDWPFENGVSEFSRNLDLPLDQVRAK